MRRKVQAIFATRLGFAIHEIDLGKFLGKDGGAHDYVRHAPDRHRRQLFTRRLPIPGIAPKILNPPAQSSPDWIAFCAASSLTTCQCLSRSGSCTTRWRMLPLRFGKTRRRNYTLEGIELGEEPDGQWVSPEDYAALYAGVARRLAELKSPLKVGGPSLQSFEDQLLTWADASGNRSWMNRFLRIHFEAQKFASNFWHLSFIRSTTSVLMLRRICWKSRSASAR